MKRYLLRLASILLALLMLVSCENNGRKDNDTVELTIASCGTGYTGALSMVIEEFEKAYGWNFNIINYDIEVDYYALQTKLLAKDPDIDLIYTPTLDVSSLIRTRYYEDLGKYDELKSRFDASNFARHAGCYDGVYFGLPISYNLSNNANRLGEITYHKYLMKNVNLIDLTYADPNGDELFEVLKHYRKYPQDSLEDPFYQEEYPCIMSEYFILSPYSDDKDVAVEFLARAFDYLNGDVEYTDSAGETVKASKPYASFENVDLDNVNLMWKHIDADDITKPLGDGIASARASDGSDEALREIASEAAKQFRMRLEG